MADMERLLRQSDLLDRGVHRNRGRLYKGQSASTLGRLMATLAVSILPLNYATRLLVILPFVGLLAAHLSETVGWTRIAPVCIALSVGVLFAWVRRPSDGQQAI